MLKLHYLVSATVHIHGTLHDPEPWEYRFSVWAWSYHHAKKRAAAWIARDKPQSTIVRLDVT
jgi:hypothetical protein